MKLRERAKAAAESPADYLKGNLEFGRRIASRHPKGIFVARLCVLAVALLISLSVAYRVGILSSLSSVPPYTVYTAVVAGIPAVIGLLSLRPGRTRFIIAALPDDPGHYNIPIDLGKVPPEVGVERYLVPHAQFEGTYPKGNPGNGIQRLVVQVKVPQAPWRSIQFKFHAVGVRAVKNDAIDCRANAEVKVLNGSEGSFAIGQWTPVGGLNWHVEDLRDRVLRELTDSVTMPGVPDLYRTVDSPSLGINRHMDNPTLTIHENRWAYLPLFYMREDYPSVFLSCRQEGLRLGRPPEDEPLRFGIRVTVQSLKSKPKSVVINCSARWDDLRIVSIDHYSPSAAA